MKNNHVLGQNGEQMAGNYLKKKGFQILETNWRSGPLEIDIIARKDDILVIAEVKTRSTNIFGEPEEFVTKAKQKNLIRAANFYIIDNDLDVEARFDIISILYKGDQFQIHHIEDAFYPTL
jgi:putative endonuclease